MILQFIQFFVSISFILLKYFELHRGTYTSQAKNKLYNRLTEYLLHDVELFNSLSLLLNASSK